MNKLKTHFVSFSVALSVAFAIVVFTLSPAYAWTHAKNNWDTNHNDYYCGTSSSMPCLYWAQPSYTSINVYAYFDPSLNNAPGNYNFTVAINRAFSDWNSQQAWNPYLYSCSTFACGSADYTMTLLPYGIWGETTWDYGTSLWNSAESFWYVPLYYVNVYFSTAVTWNNSLQFSATTADGRTVSTHETGHLLGLGHTGHTPAIMHMGSATYYTVQTDDLYGLQNIYPGYYPGSTQ